MKDSSFRVFFYLYNLQGDVVGLVDSANSIVVEYKYDAWGKLLSTTGTLASTLGNLNPFRAQVQADILSAQMTYSAGTKALNWLSNNWKDVVDWAGIVYTGAVFALNKAVKAGVVIAPWAAIAMTVVDVGFWIYSIGDKLKWW